MCVASSPPRGCGSAPSCRALAPRQQREAKCAIHALNNCLGGLSGSPVLFYKVLVSLPRAACSPVVAPRGLFCTDEEMQYALEDYLVSARREGLYEPRSENWKPGGWFSSEVIAHALNTTSMSKNGKILYVLELKALYTEPEKIHNVIGALVNLASNHWIALRSVAGQIWCLDSLEESPTKMSFEQYKGFINQHKAAYPIKHADDMRASPSAGSAADGSPLLPLVSQASRDTFADSLETVESTPPPPASEPARESNVPSLMVAESFGAEDAMQMIQSNHMERGLELEALALEARSEYESALAERGGS